MRYMTRKNSTPDVIPARKPDTASEEFGKEGTNKTLPKPKDNNASSEELGNTRHIEKSPYTRG
jgi:hypothetical protein